MASICQFGSILDATLLLLGSFFCIFQLFLQRVTTIVTFVFCQFLAHLDEVQEELLDYPRLQGWRRVGVGGGGGAAALAKSLMLKIFYVMGKVLSGELSYPCDSSCCQDCFSKLKQCRDLFPVRELLLS